MYCKNLICLSVFILILNCSRSSDSKVSDQFIAKLSVTDDSLPSPYVGYNLYVKTNNDSVIVSNVNSLHEIYSDHYQTEFKDFHSFLTALLKNNFKISEGAVSNHNYGAFLSDKKITGLPVESIVKKYFDQDKNSKKYYFYPQTLSYNTKQTILYKMFLDGYLVSFDDYGGKFIIE